MTDLPTLPTLRDRLKAATGPDRELDHALFILSGCSPPRRDGTPAWKYWPEHPGYYSRTLLDSRGVPDRTDTFHCPSPTASLDAAVALAERVLPGCRWVVESTPPTVCFYTPDVRIFARALTPPLALCLAIIEALIAKEAPTE